MKILDHKDAVALLESRGLTCVYPGSGAFDLIDAPSGSVRGWIGRTDTSIRAEAMKWTQPVPEPIVQNLANRAARVIESVRGDVWITPKSHWAYELEFGSSSWLPEALDAIGIDSAGLRTRHSGDAIVFRPGEIGPIRALILALLENLTGSDFQLTLPDHKTVCTIHHHKQLWWRTQDDGVWAAIESAGQIAG